MALTKQEAEKRFADGCEKLGLALEVNYVNKQSNVPDDPFIGGAPATLTVHETANPNPGADARMHRNFVANGGGSSLASFSLCVDSSRAVVIVDLTKATYHAGTRLGNYTSGSVETCVNSDGNWTKTKDNLAKLIAAWLNVWGLGAAAVVQHNVWYGKNCPSTIRKEGSWAALLTKAGSYLETLKGPQPEPPPANQTAIEAYHDTTGGFAQYGNPLEVDGAGRVKERTIVLPDVPGAPFQVAFYEKGVIVWRSDMGASRYNSGTWLLNTLVKHGEI
jgi:hypothetical protein